MSTFSRTGAAALARASFASTSRAASSRTYVAIPAPELANAKGEVNLAIRTFDRMRNMTYAFAIVRAIEAKYGVVLNVEVLKDADTLRPANRMFVTLLKPIELEGEQHFEIPAPKYNPAESTGGVTLAEVQAALGPAQSMDDIEATEGEMPRTIKFTLEPRTGRFREFRYMRYGNRRSYGEIREDNEIVRALESFSGGFFGGLSGVSDKFKDLITEATVDPRERKAAEEAEETLRAEVAAEEAQIARDLAAQKAKRAAAANAAAVQAVAVEEVHVKEEEVVEDKISRLEMLKNRALEAARRKAAADAEARQAAVASKAASAAARVQAAKAEPALAAKEKKEKETKEEPTAKSAWRWFEKK
ncbi:hypothetical protein CcaverHIS002_0101550 [Cutaneotrichosporon cavernicola]|uniref:Uncharacterized protein n=1 Tax=Cutaneotrichosporon cavernicola TaxID=279322 RepID=A0AA48I0T1_9TREE|nr:uncharacterized protein CcaverHIS019_0101520 [Cutaneotrichosporon cavernicola]BEI79626.1 hypothetical protein CcaverHIS002_0101550 [Cutaneotrichosporon cavernicola]BEI87434.1 hypothetical protein CcaverHIS019_0101520 [Cutaneotrichosporon cavernicola]BEI95203.1 hypothetical protein CcaverHIS631_0101520 [Cutaneotrichosporon cavernicola]BEJ02976.1 hypothetical protein CcaverHIS641_0101510 [Cutaneotrichosporon cavernicola]